MDRFAVILLCVSAVAVNCIDTEGSKELSLASTSMSPSPSTISSSLRSPIYQASVQNTSNRHICSAVILKSDWILTLAQCVSNYNPNELKVYYGSNRLNGDGKYVAVKEIHIHPSFDKSIIKSDIALLYTESIDFIGNISGSINLPISNTPVNQVLTISGWMLTNGNESTLLHRKAVTVSTQECKKLNPTLNHIIRTWLICSISPSIDDPINRANICAIDLGSVLVGDDDTLYGISTMNEETCTNANVNIYTNVFTQLTWINGIIYGWPWP